MMPNYRPDIAGLKPYEVGRPIEEVAREHGLDTEDIIKLTANESPDGPFPGVVDAAVSALASSNRYPDNHVWDLSHALAKELDVQPSNLLFGNGSTALMSDMANAVGGPGTNAVYGWPSFFIYRFASIWSGSEYREVRIDEGFALDLDAMGAAIDGDTRIAYVCNPNNPTGTIKPADDIEAFIDAVPESVLVVVDEAYHDFVGDRRYRTQIPLALERANVVVLRTFSKIYSLAAHRVGYAVGHPDTLPELRKAQQPLTVNQVGQAAALASLGQPGEVQRRVDANSAGRHHLLGVLSERGLSHAESHTNFVFFKMPGDDSREISEDFTRRGVIIRPISRGWMRVTFGWESENKRFVEVLDEVLAEMAG